MKQLELEQIFHFDNAVDCNHCPVSSDLKCCTYQPLWLCFSVGEALLSSSSENKVTKVLKDFVLSPVGFSASVEKRKLFADKGLWGFSKEADLLCSFYDKGNCSIWSTRPSVCRFYFCKSRYGMKGIEFYQEVENWLLSVEGQMLYLWLMEKGYSLKDWETLSRYMDESEVKKEAPSSLPEHLIFSDWEEAKAFYIESYRWVAQKTRDEILELSGKEKKVEYESLLARGQSPC